jgi:hypothetical protein
MSPYVSKTVVRGTPVVSGSPQALSEEKSLHKLYQTMIE